MAIKRETRATVLVAAQDLRTYQHHVVTAGGVRTTAATAITALAAVGVVTNKPNSGEHLAVEYDGEVKGYFWGTAASAGDFLTVESGMFALAASGDLRVGRALTATTSGSEHRMLVDFINPVVTATSYGGN